MQQTEHGWKVISAGPTTSDRMSKTTHSLLKAHDVRVIIGKGGIRVLPQHLKIDVFTWPTQVDVQLLPQS